jgi:DNA-binding NarL/FixJ family response regulator
MRPIRAILADDHTLVLAGLRALLLEIEGVAIVAEARNGREALDLAREHRPDIVVMDISMKELNGIEATARILSELPSTRVLILSMHSSGEFVRRALKAGASGYLVKDSAPQELRMAIEAIARDEVYPARASRASSSPGSSTAGRRPPSPRSTASPRASARSCSSSRRERAPRRSRSSSR